VATAGFAPSLAPARTEDAEAARAPDIPAPDPREAKIPTPAPHDRGGQGERGVAPGRGRGLISELAENAGGAGGGKDDGSADGGWSTGENLVRDWAAARPRARPRRSAERRVLRQTRRNGLPQWVAVPPALRRAVQCWDHHDRFSPENGTRPANSSYR